jgi:hypothetical protein
VSGGARSTSECPESWIDAERRRDWLAQTGQPQQGKGIGSSVQTGAQLVTERREQAPDLSHAWSVCLSPNTDDSDSQLTSYAPLAQAVAARTVSACFQYGWYFAEGTLLAYASFGNDITGTAHTNIIEFIDV